MSRIAYVLPLFVVASSSLVASRAVAAQAAAATVQADDARPDFGSAHSVVVGIGGLMWSRADSPVVSTADQPRSRTSQVAGALTVDTFISPRWSLGAGANLSWWHSTAPGFVDVEGHSYALTGRVGRVVPVASFASVWPTAALGVARQTSAFNGLDTTRFIAELDLPLILQATRHCFVGLGPLLTLQLGENTQQAFWGGHLVFGGTFGG